MLLPTEDWVPWHLKQPRGGGRQRAPDGECPFGSGFPDCPDPQVVRPPWNPLRNPTETEVGQEPSGLVTDFL